MELMDIGTVHFLLRKFRGSMEFHDSIQKDTLKT